MKTYLDCYPCVLRQALEAARMAGASASQEATIVSKALTILQALPEGVTSPTIGSQIHAAVRQITGNPDPYLQVKQEATEKALSLLPKLKNVLAQSTDPLETAVRLSIAGNIIDFGPNPDYNLWEEVERALHQPFAIDDLSVLRQRLALVKQILYLGDNAGETVFDRLLIETLGKPVTYVVRGGPTLNDATLADALEVGIDQVAEIIDNGSSVPGTELSLCSPEFQAKFWEAELILAKGVGNYETLSTVVAPIFFLFQVKCPAISLDVGAPVGSLILKQGLATE